MLLWSGVRSIFLVTHFYSSEEARENLYSKSLTEIVTTNTLPNIVNRDDQGRLREKIAVLKIGRWIAYYLKVEFGIEKNALEGRWYKEDMSSTHIRSNYNYDIDSD